MLVSVGSTVRQYRTNEGFQGDLGNSLFQFQTHSGQRESLVLTSKSYSALQFSRYGFGYSILRCRVNGLLNDASSTTNTLRFLQTPSLITNQFISGRSFSAVAVADNPTHHSSLSFTVSYLINSCGLSEDKAIAASKKVQFESSVNPDSVLNLFRNYEFDNTHISKIIAKCPSLLLANADKNLKPKIDFLESSLGLSGPELGKLLSYRPFFLKRSLENRIKPTIVYLKTLLPSQSQVITVIRRGLWLFTRDVQIMLAPNIALLRTHGVPDLNISKLFVSDPRSIANNVRLDEVVNEAKKLKLDPSQMTFAAVIIVLSSFSKSALDAKFDIYKRCGWSEDEVHSLLIKYPRCILLSEKNILGTMEFIVNKMGYDPLVLIRNPYLLCYSLEKRIIPRFSVINVLITNGFVKKQCTLCSFLRPTEEGFVKKFVTKYEDKFPELMKAYKAKMKGLSTSDS